MIEYLCCFVHLDHERGLTCGDIIYGAYTRKYPVEDTYRGRLGRNETSSLGEQHSMGDLPHERRLATHVGTGDQRNLPVAWIQSAIVGNKGSRCAGLLHHQMATSLDPNARLFLHRWPDQRALLRELSQRASCVDMSHPPRALVDDLGVLRDDRKQTFEQPLLSVDELFLRL